MQLAVDFKKVGERIRNAREEQHLTQTELAAKCGCTNNNVSHLETGQTKLSLTMLLRLSSALGKDLNYFLLDTPYVAPEYFIDAEISAKLSQCDPATLVAVNRAIDLLLEQQKALAKKYQGKG